MTLDKNKDPGAPEADDEIPIVTAEQTVDAPRSMVNVVAPSTLPEGYTFTAQVDGNDFQVTVPPGGVTEGQTFEVPYPEKAGQVVFPTNTTMLTEAPTGQWRNKLCSCCDVFCDCMFWMSCCLTPIVLAQLAQRLQLTALGYPNGGTGAFRTIVVFYLMYLVFCMLGVGMVVYPFYLLFFVALGANIRYNYRKHYNIPTSMASCHSCCDGMLEDCFCSCFCECCESIQIARHTHDMKNYPYYPCSETGLSPAAPPIIV